MIEKKHDFLNEIKIYKPKPRKLCNKKTKIKSILSPFSLSNPISQKKNIKYNKEESKMRFINFDNISIEEINKDFLIYGENMEEEECLNELWNILNNSSENNISELNNQKIPKVKRCKNSIKEKNINFLKENNIDNLYNEINMYINSLEYNYNFNIINNI